MATATPTARPRPVLGELIAAAEAQPGEAGPQVLLADAYRARGEASAALPLYARAARLAPQAEAVWLRWAGTLIFIRAVRGPVRSRPAAAPSGGRGTRLERLRVM